MQITNEYSAVHVMQGENPVFCYRSGLAVYEETLHNGVLVSSGWNAAGYPLNTLKNCPSRLDVNNYARAGAFDIELDGCTANFCLEFRDFTQSKCGDKLHTVLTLESTIMPVLIKVHTELDGTQMFARYVEVINKGERAVNLSKLAVLSGGVETVERDMFAARGDESKHYSIGYFGSSEWGREGDFGWHDIQPDTLSVDFRFGRDRFRHPLIFIKNNLTGSLYFSQIGWSGGCRYSVDYNVMGIARTHLSLSAEITSRSPITVIPAGESFVSPKVHIGVVSGDFDSAVNEMHRHIRKSVLCSQYTDPSALLVGAGMGAEHDMSVETSKEYIDMFARMGAELFIVDAGWVCPPDEENRWGDYNGINVPDAARYPNGLAEISDYCHEKGMKFGLWADIEGLGRFSDAYKNHPEWRACDVYGNSHPRLIDMSNPLAAEWAENELARIIEEYKIDLLRVDHNVSYREYFGMRDTGTGTPECLSVRHINAVYAMYKRLKERFPDVIFENCAGGGARTDLGMMENFNHTWVSDWQRAPRSVLITNGMTVALPPERVDRLVSGMGCHEFGSLGFHMRNAMLGHLTLNVISPNGMHVNESQLEFVRRSVDIYKNFIRKFLPDSKYYHHTPDCNACKENGVCILEAAANDKKAGALAAFTLSPGENGRFTVYPKGVNAGLEYKVTLDNTGESFTASGAELMRKGISLEIGQALGSELVLYESSQE